MAQLRGIYDGYLSIASLYLGPSIEGRASKLQAVGKRDQSHFSFAAFSATWACLRRPNFPQAIRIINKTERCKEVTWQDTSERTVLGFLQRIVRASADLTGG